MYYKRRKQLYFFNSAIILLFLLSCFFVSFLSCYSKTQSQIKAEELVFAAWDGDLEKVELLLSDGVNINSKAGPGLTALHCTKIRGRNDITELLLKKGANPDIKMPGKEKIVDMIFNRNIDNNTPGAAVAVIKDGSIIYKNVYGMANLEHKIPITPTTVFDIGSSCKQFTGMAISMLIEQGKISLEDDIRQYIPELSEFGHTITINHLIHHTSGLRDYNGVLSLAGVLMDDVISFDQILTMTFNQKELNFVPGSEYSYCNTGYILLAELVQRVTEKSFREWTDINIFQPLGMMHTYFRDDYTEILPYKAYGYFRGRDSKFHAQPNNLAAPGAGSLFTSIDDFSKWMINYENPKVGGKSVIDRMYQQGILNNGEQISYAFGLFIDEYRDIKKIWHGGGWANLESFFIYFPEYHYSFVVLQNMFNNSYKAAYDIADIYLADKFEPINRENIQEKQVSEPVDLPIQVLDEYIGTYRLGHAKYITISREGTQLMARATAENAVPMTATSESTFWVEVYGSSIQFTRDDSGHVTNFNYNELTCPKMKETSKLALEQLSEFTGEYMSEELKTLCTVAIEGEQLAFEHHRFGTFNLIHAWKDDFRIWDSSLEFYRDMDGKVSGFFITSNRSRNQRFVKIKVN